MEYSSIRGLASPDVVAIGTVVVFFANGCAMYPGGPEVDVSYYGSGM